MTLPLSYSRPETVVRGQWSGISLIFSLEATLPFPARLSLFPVPCSLETLELMTRIELVTSPLPRECSTN